MRSVVSEWSSCARGGAGELLYFSSIFWRSRRQGAGYDAARSRSQSTRSKASIWATTRP